MVVNPMTLNCIETTFWIGSDHTLHKGNHVVGVLEEVRLAKTPIQLTPIDKFSKTNAQTTSFSSSYRGTTKHCHVATSWSTLRTWAWSARAKRPCPASVRLQESSTTSRIRDLDELHEVVLGSPSQSGWYHSLSARSVGDWHEHMLELGFAFQPIAISKAGSAGSRFWRCQGTLRILSKAFSRYWKVRRGFRVHPSSPPLPGQCQFAWKIESS